MKIGIKTNRRGKKKVRNPINKTKLNPIEFKFDVSPIDNLDRPMVFWTHFSLIY